jgi:hypothetical protein
MKIPLNNYQNLNEMDSVTFFVIILDCYGMATGCPSLTTPKANKTGLNGTVTGNA